MRSFNLISSILLVACSQLPQEKKSKQMSSFAENEDRMLGNPLPEWTSKQSYIENNRLYYIGFAEMSADKNDYYISKAALMDAEVKLISVASSDFRVLTQNVLSETGMDSSAFYRRL